MRISALVVEDEPMTRRDLCNLVGQVEWLDLLGEAADGVTAVELIDSLKPDLVFMDIRLPGLSGLEVLAAIEHAPSVVFTTAYDRYAVAAFEKDAVDYLVKPYSTTRFHRTLARLRRRLKPAARPKAEPDLPLRRVFARKAGSIVPLAVKQISRIEARDDYAEVHTGNQAYLLNTTLKSLERELDPERFIRVHRSRIVNLDHVSALEPFDDRRLIVRLSDGKTVLASRAGSARLRWRLR